MADFGSRSRRRRLPLGPAMIAIAIAVVAACVIGLWVVWRSHEIAKAQAWAISGPPCETASAQAFSAWPVKPQKSFEYGGVSFLRAYGDVSCEEITNGAGHGFGAHPVCQFTVPGVLEVTTPKGDFRFIVETGPATVAVHDGVPSCVRASHFHGEGGRPTDL